MAQDYRFCISETVPFFQSQECPQAEPLVTYGAGNFTAPRIYVLSTNTSTPTLLGTFSPGDVTLSVEVAGVTYTAGVDAALVVDAAEGTWTLDLSTTTQALGDGTYTVTATQTLSNTAVGILTIDTSAPSPATLTTTEILPTTTTLSGTFDDDMHSMTVTVNGWVFSRNGLYDLSLDTSTLGWSLTLPSELAEATYPVEIVQADAFGLTTTTSASLLVTSTPSTSTLASLAFAVLGPRPLNHSDPLPTDHSDPSSLLYYGLPGPVGLLPVSGLGVSAGAVGNVALTTTTQALESATLEVSDYQALLTAPGFTGPLDFTLIFPDPVLTTAEYESRVAALIYEQRQTDQHTTFYLLVQLPGLAYTDQAASAETLASTDFLTAVLDARDIGASSGTPQYEIGRRAVELFKTLSETLADQVTVLLSPPGLPSFTYGVPLEGERITAASPLLVGTPAVKYQWLRDGVPIPKATSLYYTPGALDIEKRLALRATSGTTSYTSQATAPVAGAIKAYRLKGDAFLRLDQYIPELDGSFTMAAWVKLDKVNQGGTVFSVPTEDIGGPALALKVSGEVVQQLISHGGGLGATQLECFIDHIETAKAEVDYDASAYAGCKWAHVAYTWNRPTNDLLLYVNGDLVASTVWSPITLPETDRVLYGALWDLDSPLGVFQGHLADMRIYQGVKEVTQIQAIMAETPDAVDEEALLSRLAYTGTQASYLDKANPSLPWDNVGAVFVADGPPSMWLIDEV